MAAFARNCCARSDLVAVGPRGPIAQARRPALTKRLSPRSLLARRHRRALTQSHEYAASKIAGGEPAEGIEQTFAAENSKPFRAFGARSSRAGGLRQAGPEIESHAEQPSGYRDQSQGSAQSDAAEERLLESARSARRSLNAQARRELGLLMREGGETSRRRVTGCPFVEGRASKNSRRTVRYEAKGAPPASSPALDGEMIGYIRQGLARAQQLGLRARTNVEVLLDARLAGELPFEESGSRCRPASHDEYPFICE